MKRRGPSETPMADSIRDLIAQLAVEGYERWDRLDVPRPCSKRRL